MVGKVNWQNFPVRQAVPYQVHVYALSGKSGMRQMRARRPQHAIILVAPAQLQACLTNGNNFVSPKVNSTIPITAGNIKTWQPYIVTTPAYPIQAKPPRPLKLLLRPFTELVIPTINGGQLVGAVLTTCRF